MLALFICEGFSQDEKLPSAFQVHQLELHGISAQVEHGTILA
jgi:hypothetical protein